MFRQNDWGKRQKTIPVIERNGRLYKVCARCKIEKISTDFGYANPYLKRLNSYCNQCRREYDKVRKEIRERKKIGLDQNVI